MTENAPKRRPGRPTGRSARHAGDDLTLAKMAAAILANPSLKYATAARAAGVHGDSNWKRLREQFKPRRDELLAAAAAEKTKRSQRVVDRTAVAAGYSPRATSLSDIAAHLNLPASFRDQMSAVDRELANVRATDRLNDMLTAAQPWLDEKGAMRRAMEAAGVSDFGSAFERAFPRDHIGEYLERHEKIQREIDRAMGPYGAYSSRLGLRGY